MVFVAALCTDGRQTILGELLGEIHGQLTRLNNFTLARFAFEQFHGHVKVVTDYFLDKVYTDLTRGVLDKLVNHLLRKFHGYLLAVQGRLRRGVRSRAPSSSRTLLVMLYGKVLHHIVGHVNAVGVQFLD